MTPRTRRDDRGSMIVEVVLLAPVLVAFAMFMVAFGRVSLARQQVVAAARAGAESAAVAASPGDATWAANVTAVVGYEDRSHTCEQASVNTDVSRFYAGGSVEVTVVCRVGLSDLSLVGVPGSITVRARATDPIDPYRAIQ